jgi:three-Cys-motif partner protein
MGSISGPSGRRGKRGLTELEKRAQLHLGADWPVPAEGAARELYFKSVRPIWTEHKARLIERYLYYFVLITHHGTYIDGFAGPQEEDKPEMWSAKLVLESRPRWLQRFHLCELRPRSVIALKEMVATQPRRERKEPKREVKIYAGDFNKTIDQVLAGDNIPPKQATFALLDQRTFECDWATVLKIARHKVPTKIELFYFLPAHWFGRAFHETNDKSVIARWWGRDDWPRLGDLTDRERADLLRDRLRDELGYRYAYPWPIYSREEGEGRIKYHMVHASDHDEAPKLMRRAYEQALDIKEPPEQLGFQLG